MYLNCGTSASLSVIDTIRAIMPLSPLSVPGLERIWEKPGALLVGGKNCESGSLGYWSAVGTQLTDTEQGSASGHEF